MVTPEDAVQIVDGQYLRTQTYYGKSTDPKPTEGVGNGSCFIEVDTGKASFFDLESKEWN